MLFISAKNVDRVDPPRESYVLKSAPARSTDIVQSDAVIRHEQMSPSGFSAPPCLASRHTVAWPGRFRGEFRIQRCTSLQRFEESAVLYKGTLIMMDRTASLSPKLCSI